MFIAERQGFEPRVPRKGRHYFGIRKYLPPFLIIFFHCRTFAAKKNETDES